MVAKRSLRSVTAPAVTTTVKRAKSAASARKRTKKYLADELDYTAGSQLDEEKPVTTDSEKSYWLFKAEPESRVVDGVDVKFSFDDLSKEGQASWDGVRNYEARNCMQRMKVGDLGFFYHSSCKTPGIVGILKVCKEAYVDHTAFDPKHPYYDRKSDKDRPKWFMVDVEYVRPLKRLIGLHELKAHLAKYNSNSPVSDMALMRKSRLSVSPVKESEWDFILELADKMVDEDAPSKSA
ncbi:PUA-like domain-containing protein [Lipomyces tetrasporus]|uniref:Thymocyte nuclear protein 1 n=1 Tax=Lipomyces tetrasporus TaxID=54092 RepID=A0AAD7VW99_9ASCO|nr:PUA-like domain-containing protein [Lipomyces tetrasporus]KAJ8103886.1 PUA-like domain-containing protein [Lipomyces tetrasporus]